MAFASMLVLTFVLFARPSELFPAWMPFNPYEPTIIVCVVLGYNRLVDVLSVRSLAANPISLCIVCLSCWTILVELARVQLDPAYAAAEYMVKMLIYAFLVVGSIENPSHLRIFFKTLVLSSILSLFCAILNYHGIVSFEYLNIVEETAIVGDEAQTIRRLGTTTIFGDPNDLALFVAQCVILCLFLAWEGSGSFLLRGLWLAPAGFLIYAMSLTQSRGGLVSLMAGIGAMTMIRLRRRSVLILAPAVPIFLTIFAGRQASINLGDGTGQTRVQLWQEYFYMFQLNPLLGVGWENGPKIIGLQAHNSYLQSFGEQGFPAGTLFLGQFAFAVWALTRPGFDPSWSRFRPCLLGLVVAQMVGMMGLTRNFALPTYTVLCLAAAYVRVAHVKTQTLRPGVMLGWLLAISLGFLVFMRVLILLNLRY